jgi:hypothetical protein
MRIVTWEMICTGGDAGQPARRSNNGLDLTQQFREMPPDGFRSAVRGGGLRHHVDGERLRNCARDQAFEPYASIAFVAPWPVRKNSSIEQLIDSSLDGPRRRE